MKKPFRLRYHILLFPWKNAERRNRYRLATNDWKRKLEKQRAAEGAEQPGKYADSDENFYFIAGYASGLTESPGNRQKGTSYWRMENRCGLFHQGTEAKETRLLLRGLRLSRQIVFSVPPPPIPGPFLDIPVMEWAGSQARHRMCRAPHVRLA